MSTQLMKKISGQLTGPQGNTPVQIPFGITIEITTLLEAADPGGWIGSAAVSAVNGSFDIMTAYALGSSEQVSYRILNGNRLIQAGNIWINDFSTSITLSQQSMDDMYQSEVTGYKIIKGKVTLGTRGIAAIPLDAGSITVAAHKTLFRATELVAEGKLDNFGNYEMKVPNSAVQPAATLCGKSVHAAMILKVLHDTTLITGAEVSGGPDDCCITVDLSVKDDSFYHLFYTETGYLEETLSEVASLGPVQLPTVITEGEGNELPSLAATTGLDEFRLKAFLAAYKLAVAIGVPVDQLYSLMRENADSDYPLTLDMDSVAIMIDDAVENRIVRNVGNVTDTYNALHTQRVDTLLQGTGYGGSKVYDALKAVVSSDDAVKKFFAIHMDQQETTPAAFWNKVNAELPAYKEALQRGMQILSIAGMQAEITEEILLQLTRDDAGVSLETPRPISDVALWTRAKWSMVPVEARFKNSKVCVPPALQAKAEELGEEAEPMYSDHMMALAKDIFAQKVINKELADDSAFRGAFGHYGNDIKNFLQARSEVDLRFQKVWDVYPDASAYLTGSNTLEGLRDELAPLQNIMRLTGGKPDAVIAMTKGGIRSSADIAAIPLSHFTEVYGGALGGAHIAAVIHTKASNNSMAINQLQVQYAASALQTTTNAFQTTDTALWEMFLGNPGSAQSPDLQTMFGSMDLCSCSECMSMYSPAAYFTDVLNFMKTQLQIGTSTDSKPYNELIRRRPDLGNIDLSCKNANTPMPYVDLVNELLELMILRGEFPGPVKPHPLSYQTSGIAKELDAYPEHTVINESTGVYEERKNYEDVYDTTLRNAIYPVAASLDLPLEESRVYFKHLGYDRKELMKRFRPLNAAALANSSDAISGYNFFTESLGISRAETNIICGLVNQSEKWKFYGFEEQYYVTPSPSVADVIWYDQLCNVWPAGATPPLTIGNAGLGLLLERAGISYAEMLQLLATDFLNPFISSTLRRFSVEATDAAPGSPGQDTCDLRKLMILCNVPGSEAAMKAALMDKLHRYIRLCKATGWTSYQLDIVLKSIGATDIEPDTVFPAVASIADYANKLRTAPELIAGFWNKLDTVSYTSFMGDSQVVKPSVYDSLFLNKSIPNPPEALFEDPASWASNLVCTEEHKGPIMAAAGIDEGALVALFSYINPLATPMALNLDKLSRVYALSLIAKGASVSVKDLLRICNMLQLENEITGTAAQKMALLQSVFDAVALVKKQLFTLDELEYLLAHTDEQKAFQPLPDTIASFYAGLRADLKKLSTADNLSTGATEPLGNVILRQFSTAFNLDTALVSYLLKDVLTATIAAQTLSLYDAFCKEDFINAPNDLSTAEFINSFGYAVDAYVRVLKTATIVNRLKISTEEFMLIQEPVNPATAPVLPGIDLFGFIDFSQIATAVVTDTALRINALERLNAWIKVRDLLGLNAEQLKELWQEVIGVNGSAAAWVTKMQELTGWAEESLSFLAGDTTNVLAVMNNNGDDFSDADLSLQLIDIFSACSRIGLTPQLTYNALKANLLMEDARKIRLAAKAKHTDDQWLKIAKPLQDALREKQREALVAYVVAHPELADGSTYEGAYWKSENDLYAYLLIDVEMQPCMKTSRIKQGISSLQLFMDRVILNLENTNGNSANSSNHIYITADKVAQWKTWRKWYRIWEANRKIFLYPENWIEPELRDDKTPFFKELESHILQDDLTDAIAEEAFRGYLEKMDEVARLEPVSAYHEQEDGRNIMHVFSRTYAQPHRYYYRRLEDDIWSPWEKMNVTIKGDHVTPVVWNRRLYMFWTEFTPKTTRKWYYENDPLWVNKIEDRNNATGQIMTIVNDGNEDEKKSTWDVRLHWSQYKDGKWLATEVCNDVMNLNPSLITLSPGEASSYGSTGFSETLQSQYFNMLTKNGNDKLAELFRTRLYLSPYFDGEALILSLNFFSRADEVGAITLQAFRFPDPVSQPAVERGWEREELILSPLGTRADNMKFREIEGISPANETTMGYGKLRIEKVETYPDEHFSYFYRTIKRHQPQGYTSPIPFPVNRRKYGASTPDLLLRATPKELGKFALTKMASATGTDNESCIFNYFFYEDEVNTFYVQRVSRLAEMLEQLGNSSANYTTAEAFIGEAYTTIGGINPGAAGGSQGDNPAMKPYSYKFQTFYHAQIRQFMKALNRDGLPGLLSISNQKQDNTLNFGTPGPATNPGLYKPTNLVHANVPRNNVQFKTGDAYSIYNWELFFHAPALMAQRLSDNQQFEEAQKWYHYIFNPTSSTGLNGVTPIADKRRFWKFYPFYEQASGNPQTLQELMAQIAGEVDEALNQVRQWEKHPFQPHVIARLRILAYMKNIVMKYIDNLIAWGDQLFRQDTIESINEGTQLYILAANILGKRPENMPPRVKRSDVTFYELLDANNDSLDAFSNGQVQIEAFFTPNSGVSSGTPGSAPSFGPMAYFCLPKNDKLLAYWDTVADRLFKIRNCMNIDGLVRQLPLYEPPIDPALLVKAAALGIDIASLGDTGGVQAGPSHYRFSYTLQKANEFCNDVRGLGSSLLSALEKKDAEKLSLIRSGQELRLLEKVRQVKEKQVGEAQANLDAALLSKDNTQARYDYYSSRPFTNTGEQKQLQLMQASIALQTQQGTMQSLASTLSLIPQFNLQGLATGTTYGGQHLSYAMGAISSYMGISAAVNNIQGSMASTQAGYERRRDDWNFQAATAQKELEQMDQQILSAELRLDMAQRELTNHELQMENTQEVDTYMRSKFTNDQLYSWMSGQIATTYFLSYQLAYDMAKKAEKCYAAELPHVVLPLGGFITFGYWDSLRKGLMSGEKLQFDLRKMEASYQETNKRELELTKNFSLAMTDPEALLKLRRDGSCGFNLEKIWYDLDFPGHYQRRIKSVSISIPCIAGPYTTVASRLTLKKSYLQQDATAVTVDMNQAEQSIATSTAMNDAGVFELNFRDERYVPFENAGAISEWTLSMMSNVGLRQFNYDTISDVIIHVRYVAQHDDALEEATKITLEGFLNSATNGISLYRYFSLKHEFAGEWYKAFHTPLVAVGSLGNIGRKVSLRVERDAFPGYSKGKTITISGADFMIKPKAGTSYKLVYGATTADLNDTLNDFVTVSMTMAPAAGQATFEFVLYKIEGSVAKSIDAAELQDVLCVLRYKLG